MRIPNDVAEQQLGVDYTGKLSTIATAYANLRETIVSLYDERTWFLVQAGLVVHVSCLLEDNANPIGIILVDGPSTSKTTVLDFFRGLPMNFPLDKFTPASFLTQATNVRKKDLKNVDLLPRIVYKTIVVPELAPLFDQPKEVLLENYALLARLFDGNGLTNSGGVHGYRKLTGDYLFGFLGATTPLTQTAWNLMSKVGSRLLFLNEPARLSKKDRQKRAVSIMKDNMHYKTKNKLAKDAVRRYIMELFSLSAPEHFEVPDEVPGDLDTEKAMMKHCGYLPRSIRWDRSYDNGEVVDRIATLAEFLTGCRADVKVWTEQGEDGTSETNSTGAVTEGVDRFVSLVYTVARCHAILTGRRGVDWDDLALVVALTFSSLPDDRRKAVELLVDPSVGKKLSDPGSVTVSELATHMSCSDKTAKKVLDKLRITGIGQITSGSGQMAGRFTLHQDYDWFTTKDFQSFYRPWDKSNKDQDCDQGIVPF